MILVISTREDAHAAAVLAELTRRGEPAVLLDVAGVLSSRLHATVGRGRLLARVGDVDLSAVRAVWLRRLNAVRPLAADMPGAWAASEAASLLRSLAASLAGRRWVNPLAAALATDGGAGKLSQLEAARACGLEVPETLATNSPEAARAFVAAMGERGAVYKPFQSPHLEDKRAVFTRRVLATDDFSGVAQGPCIFQELIPKRVDVRGLVVGERVLAAEIHSQGHPDSSVDFRRRYALGETRYAVHALPADVAQRVVAVHSALGLVFGAFDLVQRPDGSYVFLETNQMGQWLWLQDQAGLPLVSAVADLLSSR